MSICDTKLTFLIYKTEILKLVNEPQGFCGGMVYIIGIFLHLHNSIFCIFVTESTCDAPIGGFVKTQKFIVLTNNLLPHDYS